MFLTRIRTRAFARCTVALFLTAAAGSAISACDDKKVTAPVVTAITIQQSSLALSSVGATGTLTANVTADGVAVSTPVVTWTSSTPAVATVSASGPTATVTAVSEGSTTITATSSGKSATVQVTVSLPRVLTVTLAGAGSGSVVSVPAGISNCARNAGATAGTCTASFAANTSVTLTPTAGASSAFDGWTGACTGTANCVVTMDQARNVSGSFSLVPQTLTVVTAGTGNGTVTSAPAGVTCTRTNGAVTGSCSAPYAFGTAVTLSAAPASGSAFTGWTGACAGTAACVVTLDQARSVTATFTFITNPLTIVLAGAGAGTVTSVPAGINCTRSEGVNSGTCTFDFAPATSVTLTAAGNVAMVFNGWSGADCTGTLPCIVSMDQARSATGTFDNPCFVTPYTLGATVTGSISATTCPRTSGNAVLYQYTVATQTTVQVTSTSTNATTRVFPFVPALGVTFAGAVGTTSTANAVVAPGTHFLGVTQGTPGSTYSLTTTANPTLSCESIVVTLGITLDATMSTAPTCAAYTPTGLPATAARSVITTLQANRQLRVTVTSAAFLPVIELRDATNGAVVKSTATDAATGTAVLTFSNTFTNGYRIMITSRAAGSVGAYRVVIDP